MNYRKMDRFRGILHHTLRGINGWSDKQLVTIDVARVISIKKHRRLFCLLQQNAPWTLTINYYLPRDAYNFAPVIGSHPGVAITYGVITEHSITKRYSDEFSVDQEISEIQKKISDLDRFSKKLSVLLTEGVELEQIGPFPLRK